MKNRFLLLSATALVLASPACMFAPYDGQSVSSTSTVLDFNGSDYQHARGIQIQAYNHSSNQFQLLTRVTPSSSPQRYDGSDWFMWQTSQAIPASFWRAGLKSGSFARVRALREGADGSASGGSLTSVERDFANCAAANGDRVGQFLANCASPNSPEAYVYTSAYPRTVDMVAAHLVFSPSGTTVYVDNAGRPGRVTRIECNGANRSITSQQNRLLRPRERATFLLNLIPYVGETIRCTVFATDLKGVAEPVTCTPEGGPTGPLTCDDNTIVRRFFP